eukprot:gene9803-20392_t
MSVIKKRPSSKHHSHYLSGLGGKHKFTTRHLAALDFLLNIPLKNQDLIIQHGNQQKAAILNKAGTGSESHDMERGSLSDTLLESMVAPVVPQIDDAMTHAPGRKLQGRPACTGRIPIHFRFRMNRFNELSAVVRQWEESLIRGQSNGADDTPQPLLESRIFYSRARGYPTAVFSVIKYAPEEEAKRLERQRTEDSRGLQVFMQPVRDWRGTSYNSSYR